MIQLLGTSCMYIIIGWLIAIGWYISCLKYMINCYIHFLDFRIVFFIFAVKILLLKYDVSCVCFGNSISVVYSTLCVILSHISCIIYMLLYINMYCRSKLNLSLDSISKFMLSLFTIVNLVNLVVHLKFY